MSYEEEMQAALGTFMVEARDLLQEMESGLLGLEEADDPAEVINAVFRAAHTIKGSSGLFGLDPIVRFTHVVESVLDRLRHNEIQVSADLVGVLLPCQDHIVGLVEHMATGQHEITAQQSAVGAALIERLQPYLTGAPAAAPSDAELAVGGDAQDPYATELIWHEGQAAAGGGTDRRRTVHLSLRFGPDCLRSGMDPLSFVRYVCSLGSVTQLATFSHLIPEAAQMDAETCYLDFEITLVTAEPVEEIWGVFDFVREESDIRILSQDSEPDEFPALIESYGEHAHMIEEVLRASTLYPPQPRAQTDLPQAAQGSSALAGGGAVAPAAVSSAATPAAATSGAADGTPTSADAGLIPRQGDRRAAESRSIRVDAPRLDRVIDGVGELVIAGASASLSASLNGDETLVSALGEVMRLVEEVRDSALQLRMVPIGTTFSRFQRVVRDVASDLGKDVALVITGGETEVDKALVERIGDPLTHLVRNSMDHGIEMPQDRVAAGKPARGTLRLNAFHDSGSIVIEVEDDGRGIDPERILAKAIERGIVEPGANLSDKEIYDLIFEPGFSTAAVVSDLSGRGVGMDVVKRNVSALRGTIDVDSRPGQGTTMRIRLPLTLAIIDGFLVGVAGASFIVPLDRVVECVELPADIGERECMDLRGEVLPFIRLRSMFDLHGERQRRENVVVVEYAGQKTGLVVDALMGEFQTVIKPLGRLFEHVQGVGGSTILGNGDVALIVDVPMLVRHHTARSLATVGG